MWEGCHALQGSFSVGDKSSVISEEEVTGQLLKCLCVGLQPPEVKRTAVKVVADEHKPQLQRKHTNHKGVQMVCKNI